MQKFIIPFLIFQCLVMNYDCQAGLFGPGPITIFFKLVMAEMELRGYILDANQTIQADMNTMQESIETRLKYSQIKDGKQECVTAHRDSLSTIDSNSVKTCNHSLELGGPLWQLGIIRSEVSRCGYVVDSQLCYDHYWKEIDTQISKGKEDSYDVPVKAAECFLEKYDEALEIMSAADKRFDTCNGQI